MPNVLCHCQVTWLIVVICVLFAINSYRESPIQEYIRYDRACNILAFRDSCDHRHYTTTEYGQISKNEHADTALSSTLSIPDIRWIETKQFRNVYFAPRNWQQRCIATTDQMLWMNGIRLGMHTKQVLDWNVVVWRQSSNVPSVKLKWYSIFSIYSMAWMNCRIGWYLGAPE